MRRPKFFMLLLSFSLLIPAFGAARPVANADFGSNPAGSVRTYPAPDTTIQPQTFYTDVISLGGGREFSLDNTSRITALAAGPSGWDYNLTKRCATTTGNPGEVNYYADKTQCGTDGKHWTLVVQSEKTALASCPGPTNRSFLINGGNSPVRLQWLSHTSDIGKNWSVNLKVDHNLYPHPCGSGYFTFFAFHDHVDHQGGPLPASNQLVSSHIINYAHFAPSGNDSARMIAAAQFFYNGKAHMLEINLASINWGDGHPHPGVIVQASNWGGMGEYVALNGPYWGLSVTPGQQKTIFFDWKSIFAQVVANGWFEAPSGPAATQTVYLAVEVKGRAVADLWHTNFRVAAQ